MQIEVKTELSVPIATVQILDFDVDTDLERTMDSGGACVLHMSLTPRPGRSLARFGNHWDSRRFEPAGSIFMIPPHELVEWRSAPCRLSSMSCQLNADAMPAWLEGGLEWPERGLPIVLDLRSMAVRQLMSRLHQELRNPGFAAESMVELLATQLGLELARLSGRVEWTSSTSGLSPWRLRQIDERLAESERIPSLAELASLCGLSVRQLTRAFRESRGCTIGDYIAQRRAEAAKRLLSRGDRSIKAIARELGFGSPAGFTYAFRQVVGMTPREFRSGVLER